MAHEARPEPRRHGKQLNDASGLMVPGKPAKVRNREVEAVCERDPDGRIVVHHRVVDTLGRMLKSGTIDQTMRDAGRDLQAAFIVAQLDPMRAMPILRVSGARRDPELSERQLDARRRVHEALQALGGISSPLGSWAWHVLGCQRSIREWAMRQGWGGRPLHVQQAQGIALAALDLLARHFGYRAGTAA
jgi:Domain of unknown function (DUF6456)